MEKAVEQRGTGWKRGDRIIRSESGYFFSFIRSVPSLWQLRAIYVTAKLSLLMRFFRPRARARFRSDLDIGSGLHPPEIWNAGIDYACLQACLVNQPSDFSIARFPTPPRAQKTTNDYDYCVKSMFDKPFSNAVHPENRARKKLRQTFYHSALFVSEKKKKIRGIAMSVRGLSRWIIGSSTSSSRWIIISSSGIGEIGKLLAIPNRLFYSNHCEDRG